MTWEGSGRVRSSGSSLPSDWSSRRLDVLRRDRFKCQHRDREDAPICGERANQVDHIVRGSDHSFANLQSLCQVHHARKTSKEGNDARREKYRTRDEPEKPLW